MASYHLSVHPNISRGRGQSLVRAAAYNARARLKDERTGRVWDYRRYGGVLFEGIYAARAPDWARDLAQLVNAIERSELRRDAQLAMNIDIALPHEQTLEQNRRLVQDFVREQFMRAGYAAHVVIHAPDPEGDQRNVHAHVLVTLRKIGPEGFARTKAEQQERYRNRSEFVEQLREKWEALANRHLARNGIDARIDRRSLQRQGVKRTPGQHRGPALTAMERRGQLAAAKVEPQLPKLAVEVADPKPAPETSPPIAETTTPAAIEPYQHDDTDRSPPAMQMPKLIEALETEASTYRPPSADAPALTTSRPIVAPEPEIAGSADFDERCPGKASSTIIGKRASLTGAIRGLFRTVAKALARRGEDEPQPKTARRRGETEGEFRRMMRYLSRRFDVRQQFRQRASITSRFLTIPAAAHALTYLSDTFDQLSQLDNEIDTGDDFAEPFDANSKHIFPEP